MSKSMRNNLQVLKEAAKFLILLHFIEVNVKQTLYFRGKKD